MPPGRQSDSCRRSEVKWRGRIGGRIGCESGANWCESGGASGPSARPKARTMVFGAGGGARLFGGARRCSALLCAARLRLPAAFNAGKGWPGAYSKGSTVAWRSVPFSALAQAARTLALPAISHCSHLSGNGQTTYHEQQGFVCPQAAAARQPGLCRNAKEAPMRALQHIAGQWSLRGA